MLKFPLEWFTITSEVKLLKRPFSVVQDSIVGLLNRSFSVV